MAATIQDIGNSVNQGERFAQLARAGFPFNPLNSEEITGANLIRLQASMKAMNWTDPRFISLDQAKALDWAVNEGASRVQTRLRDETSGGQHIVALYNAGDVKGMPPLDAFISMSPTELAALRSVANGHGAAIEQPITENIVVEEMDDDDFSIGPARELVRTAESTIAAQEPVLEAAEAVQELGLTEVGAKPQLKKTGLGDSSGAAVGDVATEKKDADRRFAILAPYWVEGLHNAEGVALAAELNQKISVLRLSEDLESIKRLMDVDSRARRLGLAVVSEEVQRNDAALQANAAEPRTLLAGALVRDERGAYRPAQGGRPVLQDNGTSVSLKSKTADGYKAAMELAIAKGWTAIELKGKPAMLADAWLEAKLRGLDVVNYAPTKADLEKFGARVAEENARAVPLAAAPEALTEMVEMRPYIDAEGHAKTATVSYTVFTDTGKPELFESANDAAARFAKVPSVENAAVVRTVTRMEGESREDVVAIMGDLDKLSISAKAGKVVDQEFDQAMQSIFEPAAAIETAELNGGTDVPRRHIGPIVEVKDGRLGQSVGRGEVVWHDIDNLEGPLPAIGDMADIEYQGSTAHNRAAQQDKSTGMDRGR
jgi:hypothetical protein